MVGVIIKDTFLWMQFTITVDCCISKLVTGKIKKSYGAVANLSVLLALILLRGYLILQVNLPQ